MSKDFSLEQLTQYLMSTLRTYDIRHVTPGYMTRLEPKAQGLVNLERKKIYLRDDLQNGDHDRVFLHEVAHIYKDGLLNQDAPEEEIWNLAYAWLNTIYKRD